MNEPHQQSTDHSVEDRYEDEIDLRDLVRSLWETRFVVAIAVFGFAGLFWLAVIASTALEGLDYSWETRIHFHFDGASEGRYPNETPFSSADLLSPVVVQRVYEMNDLAATGLGRAEFSGALSVTGYAPTRAFILKRYRAQMERDELTASEVTEIEQAFAEELERAGLAQARLVLSLTETIVPDGSVMSDEVARKVLLDIPRVWARYMTEDTGVFASNTSLYSAEAIESDIFGLDDELITTDVIKDHFDLLASNLDALGELVNAGAVRDPETGLQLSDIEARATWLENFVLEDIRATTLQLGFPSNPLVTIRFFRNRIEELERQKVLLEARADRVQQALQDYLSGQAQSPSSTRRNGTPAMLPDGLRGGTTIPQFGSDFLDRLVELGSDSGDVQFRQNLTRERLDYTLEAAELQAEISRMNELVNAISNDSASRNQADTIPDEVIASRQRIDLIEVSLRELFLATERIGSRLNELRAGSQDAIYTIVRPPDEATSPYSILTRSNLQRFLLGAILVAMLSVIGVFLFNMLRERDQD